MVMPCVGMDGRPGFKATDTESAQCFTYNPDDPQSKTMAKNRAQEQARAIAAAAESQNNRGG